MNRINSLFCNVVCIIIFSLINSLGYAGIPLWTFTPLTPTTITVAANETATIQYQITNQSTRTHTLVMRPIRGVTQISSGGGCGNPFILTGKASCTLTLLVEGSELSEPIIGGPVVCQYNSSNPCYRPGPNDLLNISTGMRNTLHTVGGTVSGLSGTVVLQNNGSDSLSISSNGSFTFSTPIAEGETYNVTVQTQPATQTCSVVNGMGTMGTSNVTNVTVTCSVNTFTVGGTVSGLSGTVTLQNNGADTLPLSSNGVFTFPTPVAQGSPYNVTVLTQPSGQICSVTNGSGTMGSSNVTNVTVTCLNSTTLSIPSNGTIPVNNTIATDSVTVTNTGSEIAFNVHINLPSSWTSVVQDATSCASLASGASCQINLRSTTPYIAEGNIVVTGDNIDTPPSMALAFTIQSELVFAIESSTQATVLDTVEFSAMTWGLAIDTPGTSLTDGFNNTAIILAQNPSPPIVAARVCFDSTRGGAAAGTWYLPAICQMGPSGFAANCPAGLPNIYTNLVAFGFAAFIGGTDWSSTQAPPDTPSDSAYVQDFVPPLNQLSVQKTNPSGILCVRSVTYP